MTHTIRFEHVQGRGAATGIAYAQEVLVAPGRLGERDLLRYLERDKGYRCVKLDSIHYAATDANEVQRDLDRLLGRSAQSENAAAVAWNGPMACARDAT